MTSTTASVCGPHSGELGGREALMRTLNVNGAVQPVRVMPGTTIAAALRGQLGLTSVKLACERQSSEPRQR